MAKIHVTCIWHVKVLLWANSKAAEGVSASDMNKRHKLEQIK
ncbi:hypothetical protein DOY81_011838, partial [Sarcophaga bullata]